MNDSNWLKFWRFWFPAILYSGIIFCASSVPNVTTPLPEMHFDAILHVVLYSPFGFLMARAVRSTKTSISKAVLIKAVLMISFLYGCSDEFHQSFLPGRNAEMFDLAADTIGGGIGAYLYLLFLRRWKNK